MTKKLRHVLGISGGKDSAALAIYMKDNYPQLDIEYYCCDTGKELEATYKLIDNLEHYLGKPIIKLRAAEGSTQDPFDHYFHIYGGYLPSSNARWCTKKLKLEPFENFVGNDPVISYVGIRGDEDREGYISTKPNIQSVFPFRKNIWSEDVVNKVLHNGNIDALKETYSFLYPVTNSRTYEILEQKISARFTVSQKFELLLSRGIKELNHVVFELLKVTNYPIALENYFPLLDDENSLVLDNIFEMLRKSKVGVPDYYEKKDFLVKNKVGQYARSRSGCYFCFFQQKIEWVWLYEQHPKKFEEAMQYENKKEGFTWNQNESLQELTKPERIQTIKEEFLNRNHNTNSPFLLDILNDAESEGCAACFI